MRQVPQQGVASEMRQQSTVFLKPLQRAEKQSHRAMSGTAIKPTSSEIVNSLSKVAHTRRNDRDQTLKPESHISGQIP